MNLNAMSRSVFLIPLMLLACTPRQNGVPEWARHAVWYQIFPERFRNGDTTNDPTAEDIRGSWPHVVNPAWQVSSWTGDWYERQVWERDDRPFYQHIQQRRYGGDLQGVLDKIPYLKDLGVTALYFNPLFESPSLHKYDATMFHHIDNNFGPNPKGDAAIWSAEVPGDRSTWRWTSADSLFLRVVEECHRANIRVIVDGVFNHVGMTFWAFLDVRKNGEQSPYKDWFNVSRYDDPNTPEDEFAYEGWMGVKELPELRESEEGLLPPIRDHVFDVVTRWMDPNGDGDPSDGIDGWRLDVAEKVERAFWKKFRSHVRSINPDAYLVGEVWWEDWRAGKMFNAAPWLQGDVFDAVMNYRLARECVRFFAGDTSRISASEFVRRIDTIRTDYPADATEVLLNLYDSHDTDRLGSRVANPDLNYDQRVGVTDNPMYEIRKPTDAEWRVAKSLVLFQMTYVGAPSVYAGSESGMWGGDDPDCRKPVLWDDLVFANERAHPFGGKRPDDANAPNLDVRNWYKATIAYRNQHAALRTGSFRVLLADDDRRLLVFVRESAQEAVLVAFNVSGTEQRIQIELPENLRGRTWAGGVGEGKSEPSTERIILILAGSSGLTLHTVPS